MKNQLTSQTLLTGGNETTKAEAETKQKTLRETAN